MQIDIKKAVPVTANESAYLRERRTNAQVLETADAKRAELRRISFALIDSTASKWRYSVTTAKI